MANFNLMTEPKAAFASFEEATVYLEQACVRMNVNHLSYWLVSSVDGTPDQVSWIATYDPVYMNYYMTNYTPLGDPTFQSAVAEYMMVDWADNDPTTRNLLLTAKKYGVTKYGISFPLKDGNFGDVLFSVNVNSNDADWPVVRGDLVARFRPFALYFHERAKPLIESRKFTEIDFAA